jgi:hypothetical protein
LRFLFEVDGDAVAPYAVRRNLVESEKSTEPLPPPKLELARKQPVVAPKRNVQVSQ